MIKLLIMADDFTGALDSGVQLAKQEIDTVVTVLDNLREDWDYGDAQVLSVNLESRHDSPENAYEKVFRLSQKALEKGIFLYKKTDSTLRGNIGSELAALLEASGKKVLHFVPAYPQTGRVTKGGYQYVDGKLIADSVFGADPFEPVRQSFIPDIIGEQSSIPARIVGQEDLEVPFIQIHDAVSYEDLQRTAGKFMGDPLIKELSGCAGFAEYLPTLCSLSGYHRPRKRVRGEHILFISGSMNEITIQQLAYARNCGYPIFTMSHEQMLNSGFWLEGKFDDFVEDISDKLMTRGVAIVRNVSCKENCVRDKREADKNTTRVQIMNSIGRMVSRVLEQAPVDTLVIFGGDTLLGVIRSLGASGIIPLEEIDDGIVVSRVEGLSRAINVVSKAGGFGEKNIVDVIYQSITEKEVLVQGGM